MNIIFEFAIIFICPTTLKVKVRLFCEVKNSNFVKDLLLAHKAKCTVELINGLYYNYTEVNLVVLCDLQCLDFFAAKKSLVRPMSPPATSSSLSAPASEFASTPLSTRPAQAPP